jgi:hypothetical protein
MSDRVQQLTSEIKEIYEQYLAEVGAGGYKVWPKSIRDRVLLLSDLVGSAKKAAGLCDFSVDTIYQWRAEVRKSHFKSIAVVEAKNKSVTVTAPVRAEALEQELGTVTVTTPGGFRIEGQSDVVLTILKSIGSL